MQEDDVKKDIFYGKMRNEMKRLTDLNVGKDAVNLMLDFMFYDFKDKIKYAETQARFAGMKTIKAEQIMDVFSHKMRMKIRDNSDRIEIPQEVWNSLTGKEQDRIKKIFNNHGWRVLIG